jgi:glycosyltransferase involved in cell wall biosynthesis
MIWFDVTNIWMRKSAVLTGTQRTSVHILRHLLAKREDVRLFKYDRKLCRINEVLRDTPNPDEWRPKSPREGSTNAAAPWPIPIARGLVAKFPFGRRRPVARDNARAGASELSRKASAALFKPADVILSMSTNRGQERYADTIAANRSDSNVKYVSFIYDLIPALFPQWVAEGAAERFERWVMRELQNADMVLTISQYQKAELTRFMASKGIAPKPIDVVYLGDDHFRTRGSSGVEPVDPPRLPFVLCVAALDARKNHYALYHVWRRLAVELGENCPRLMLVGRRFMLSDDLLYQIERDPIVDKLIIHRQGVPDDELDWYYRNCLFTIFPSHYEGWGLPVAESLGHGKVCLASNAASIPEIGGDLVDYFDAIDILGCHGLAHRAITDGEYRAGREEEIRRRYASRSWADAADIVSKAVDKLVAGP